MGNETVSAGQGSGKLLNYNFIAIFVANMLMYLGKAISNTVFSPYVATLGNTATMIGFLGSLFTVSALIMKLFAGPTIDAFSRKNVLTFSMLCMAIGYSGYGFVTSTVGIVILKLLEGCGQAFVNVTCIVVISATVPKEKVGSAVGTFSVAQVLAQAAGPTVGLYLAELTSYKLTFLSAGVVLLIGAVLTMTVRLPFEKKGKFKLTAGSFWAKEALLPAILIFLFIGASNSINSFLVVFAQTGLGLTANAGLYFTVQNIANVATRPIFGKLSDKVGNFPMICISSCSMVIVFLLIANAHGIAPILVAAVVGCLGFGPLQPVLQAMAMKFVPVSKRGAASSMLYIFMDLSTLIIPTVAGFMADSWGYVMMWYFLLALIVIAFVIALAFRRTIKESESIELEESK